MKTSVRVAGFLLYTALLIFGLWLLFYYDAVLLEHRKMTFEHWPYFWYRTLYPILIGIFLAVPSFVRTFRSYGRWKFDWIQFVTVGIPTLCGTFAFLIYYSPMGQYLSVFSFLVSTPNLSLICGIALGYFLLYCFQKKS
ncbi:MAG TPA: hypothetical protein VEZ13_14080 [Brevibacillus sp.]|nr:hypothetical protein [Brevibacillus sp.]